MAPIKATGILRLPRRSRRMGTGRLCEHPGCTTRLSTYNQSTLCFAHRTFVKPRLRGRKPNVESHSSPRR